MLENRTYVRVILPLKLDWEPCYHTEGFSADRLSPGTRVRVLFSHKEYIGVVSECGVLPDTDPARIQPLLSLPDDLPPISPAELELWRQVADYYMCPVGEVYKAAYPSGKIAEENTVARIHQRKEARQQRLTDSLATKEKRLAERLEKKTLQCAAARKEATRAAYAQALQKLESELATVRDALGRVQGNLLTDKHEETLSAPFSLTASQEAAARQIRRAFRAGKVALLSGIPGSGKTEIYIQLALEAWNRGENVLYLVPEIALSRQLEERLEVVFGDHLLVFHSARTAARRVATAASVREGRYVLLGTRSALFLPHHDLGLVIVDEEQDSSYKQESPAPRYHGRDTAVLLARIHHARMLLGSATPSLETLYNCRTGRFSLIQLTDRYFSGESARIEIIDTLAERRKNGMLGAFSRKLADHIRETLSAGGQVLLLRPRRAFSPAVQCDNCGDIPVCPRCHVPLSLHREEGAQLLCHHCGYRTPFPDTCPRCGGTIHPLGTGTQRVEEEAKALFPEARIARLDGDAQRNAGFAETVIRDFSQGDIDILIGTQIISKGFDFKGLRLVAALGADALLGQQDFRADEKALQTFIQLMGRCARREGGGLFVIQTSRSDHPVYRLLGGGAGVLDEMLAERHALAYPPFYRQIDLTVKGNSPEEALTRARDLSDAICRAFGIRPTLVTSPAGGPLQLTGPFSPVPDRTGGTHLRRLRLLLARGKGLGPMKKDLYALLGGKGSWSSHVTVNVDPA